MGVTVQLKKTSATTPTPAASYVGPLGEVVFDTDTICLRLQDGSTPGGKEICPGGTPSNSPVTVIGPVTSGTTQTITPTTWYTQLIWASPTAGAKTTNIPAAASGNKGWIVSVATTLNNGDTHNVVPASGTIGGQASISFTDSQLTGSNVPLMSDGVSNWILL